MKGCCFWQSHQGGLPDAGPWTQTWVQWVKPLTIWEKGISGRGKSKCKGPERRRHAQCICRIMRQPERLDRAREGDRKFCFWMTLLAVTWKTIGARGKNGSKTEGWDLASWNWVTGNFDQSCFCPWWGWKPTWNSLGKNGRKGTPTETGSPGVLC